MKRIMIIPALAAAVIFFACAKDYSRDIIGTWDAGRATLDKNMTVIIKADGNLTAEIQDLNMKPIKGTYRLDKNSITFKFSTLELSYRIVKIDRRFLVMKSRDARITWNRVK